MLLLVSFLVYKIIIQINLYISDKPEEDLTETIRSVSSQMGDKEMSGFTYFARELRTKSIIIYYINIK